MITGPKVDIHVAERKKHCRLPKLLLCYYSPYFDRCFNGGFKEGVEQKLEFPNDKIEDFEILLEYMLRGTTPGFNHRDLDFIGHHMRMILDSGRFAMGEFFCELLSERFGVCFAKFV